MTIQQMAGSIQDTRDNIGSRDSTRNPILKRNAELIQIEENSTVIKTNTIGHSFILGHPTNGVLGTANGVDGEQIVLGEAGRSGETVVRVVNPNNTFREHFRDDDFIDTGNSTGSLNTTDKSATTTVDTSSWGEIITLS